MISLATISFVIASSAPATAGVVSWPTDGEFAMGDVTWTISGNGIVSGTDSSGVFNTPVDLMHSLYINNGEMFDCTHGDPAVDAVVTAEDNGDFTITCPLYDFDEGYGTTGQLIIRLFAPIDGQYWARSWYHYDVDWSGQAWDFATKDLTRTAYSSTSEGAIGDVAVSRVWFDPSAQTNSLFTEQEDNGSVYQTVSEDVSDGRADFIFFDVVVVPADETVEGAIAAAEDAANIASNFRLTDRFQIGLDTTVHYSGWTLSSDATSSSGSVLADTGAGQTDGLLAGSAVAISLGGLIAFRRRNSRVQTQR